MVTATSVSPLLLPDIDGASLSASSSPRRPPTAGQSTLERLLNKQANQLAANQGDVSAAQVQRVQPEFTRTGSNQGVSV